MVHYVIDPSVLLHRGVKGMKWGVRKDRPSPSTEVANPKPSTTSRLNAFLHKPKNPKGDTPQDRQDSWGRSELKTRNSKFHRMVSGPRLMSDAELKARISRMKLEKQYNALVAAGTQIQIERSTVTRWRGNIWERVTRFIRAI